MENTVIIKKDGTSIDSKDCHLYSLVVRMTQKSVDVGDKPESRPNPSKEELVAHTKVLPSNCLRFLNTSVKSKNVSGVSISFAKMG